MDEFLLGIKATEQQLVGYLQVYKRCRTNEERNEVRRLIFECEARIEELRKRALEFSNKMVNGSEC
jgi:hypothetical protein